MGRTRHPDSRGRHWRRDGRLRRRRCGAYQAAAICQCRAASRVRPQTLEGRRIPSMSGTSFRALQRDAQDFAAIEGYQFGAATLTGDGEPVLISAPRVTPGLLQTLGVRPARRASSCQRRYIGCAESGAYRRATVDVSFREIGQRHRPEHRHRRREPHHRRSSSLEGRVSRAACRCLARHRPGCVRWHCWTGAGDRRVARCDAGGVTG